jgi:hypothetical protein
MSTLLPPWPDAELVYLDLLEPLGGPNTSVTHTDEDFEPPAIQVQRTGGSDDGVTDRAQMQVTCFGRTRQEAWALSGQVQQLVLSMSGGGVVSGDYVTNVLIDYTETTVAGRQLPYTNPDMRTVVSEFRTDFRRQF